MKPIEMAEPYVDKCLDGIVQLAWIPPFDTPRSMESRVECMRLLLHGLVATAYDAGKTGKWPEIKKEDNDETQTTQKHE